jgi:hypothetical protein
MSVEAPASDQSSATEVVSNDPLQSVRRSDLARAIKANLVICGVSGLLSAVALDGGVSFQAWYFATAAYWSAMLLIWFFHRKDLSRLDVFIAAWGFLIALFTAPLLAGLFWRLYGGGAPLRNWLLS